MMVDIHTHTFPASDDSSLAPEQLIAAAKRIGLDGICITDHDRFWLPQEADELSRAHDFLVLPGCEVTTDEGHLLVYGLSEHVFGMHRASFVRELVDEAGGVVVVAHPHRRVYREEADLSPAAHRDTLEQTCENLVFSVADAVEVLNGRATHRENAFSHDVAKRLGMAGTGASDAHRLQDLGTFATEFRAPVRCLADFIGEVKAGRFTPIALAGRPSSRMQI